MAVSIIAWLPVGVAIVLGLVILLFFSRSASNKQIKGSSQGALDVHAVAATKSVPSKPKVAGPSVRILYGTQTGTAERFAKQLFASLRSRYNEAVDVEVLDIENYKAPERLATEKLVLFLMATYGDGEPTDSACEFFNWITETRDKLSSDAPSLPFEGVSFGVFGLGNKQYDHFCSIGKGVHKIMQELGAKPIVRRGDGDDDDAIDDDFAKWSDDLMKGLQQHAAILGQSLGTEEAPTSFEEYEVVIAPADRTDVEPFPKGTGVDQHHPYWATVTTVKQLYSPAADRTCVHVEVDISGATARYAHGDHIGVYSRNSQQVVAKAAALLGLPLTTKFSLKKPAQAQMLNDPFPGPLTLETALACFTDLLASPHSMALAALASAATDSTQAERLRKLASSEGKAEYAEYIQSAQRSLLEVMEDFPSAKPSLGLFFGCIAPRLAPRMYSISSSPQPHPTSVHITCAVVRDKMPTGRVHEGVCSTWLERCKVGDVAPVFIRHSTFKLPTKASTPVIMVGPGTGLAPFRGFLQEMAGMAKAGEARGPAHLFFGCRKRAHDFMYQDELNQHVQSGVLTKLHTAFSREGSSKDYVQHHIERNGEDVWRLLVKEGGYFYVCGEAKHMAKDVHRVLIALYQKYEGISGTQAEARVKELTDSGRYMRDVW